MNFETFRLLYLALGPGVAIAIYLYYSDKWDPEPKALVIRCFLLGGIAVFPCSYMEALALNQIEVNLDAVGIDWKKLVYTFFVVALLEEAVKFLILKEFVYDNPHFNEPFDGLIYGGMVGCGFASIENLLYVLPHGMEVGILRMVTAVPGHAFGGMILGYFFGTAKFSTQPETPLVLGFFSVVLMHGTYDALALSREAGSFYLIFGIGVLVIYFGLKAKRHLERHSRILEYCDREYCLIQKGKKTGPLLLKNLRDQLASGKVHAEDPVCEAQTGKHYTVKGAIYRELHLKRRALSRIPPKARPLVELFAWNLLTYGLYLYIWFYRVCKDIRTYKRAAINPELRVVGLFVVSIIPFYTYGQFMKNEEPASVPMIIEGLFVLSMTAVETLFFFSLVRLVYQMIGATLKTSTSCGLAALLFFILTGLRKAITMEWWGNWFTVLVLIGLQGAILVWIQKDLNRFWTSVEKDLEPTEIKC